MSTPLTEPTSTDAEHIYYQAPLHWATLIGPSIIGAGVCIFGAMIIAHSHVGGKVYVGDNGPAIDPGWAGILIMVVGILLIGFGFLYRESTQLTVTDRRVTIESGVFAHRTMEIMLHQVESVSVDQGVLGQILGYGSVIVRGSGGTPEPLVMVAHPDDFRRQIENQVAARGTG